ncbi:copper chaperone [Salinadaptatus halalkaliphilus]|uniref:Copper chaperone n=1 Tax=Salinadaptatus halalkaliphilus TaxID=2419781 RepID=A0A4S3THL2_9EURY|nr:heavy-metal-associated domain-containing protein [Salinadaptatus halalkaliphilus]THE63469.1 copper chaperone [Salinadaptatus halalkaliphilus]
MERTTLEVTGMACDGCESTVVEALESLSGVSSATANHEADEVQVEHDTATVNEEAITSTIVDAGYEPAA